MTITLKGVDKLNRKLRKLAILSEEEAEKALTKIGLDLQGKAQRLAPVDTGDLRGSAFTVVGKKDISKKTRADKHPKSARSSIPSAGELEAVVGFTEPYALRQHEDMELRHPRGGEAKFLETPFKENKNKYVDLIGKAISRAVKK